MRAKPWLIGLALGLASGTVLLVLLVPAVVWAAREKRPLLALGALAVGTGAGIASLTLLNLNPTCVVVTCTIPADRAPYVVVATALVLLGAALSLLGARSRGAGAAPPPAPPDR